MGGGSAESSPSSSVSRSRMFRPVSAGNVPARSPHAHITFSPPTPGNGRHPWTYCLFHYDLFCIFLDHGEKSLGSSDSSHVSMAVTPIFIQPNRKGYGLTLKPTRVYIGDSNNYKIHHIVQVLSYYPCFFTILNLNVLLGC